MMERTHNFAGDDPPFIELEASIEAARQGDRDALGRALSSVRDYLLLVANDGLQPAAPGQGDSLRPGAGDFSASTAVCATIPRAHGE